VRTRGSVGGAITGRWAWPQPDPADPGQGRVAAPRGPFPGVKVTP